MVLNLHFERPATAVFVSFASSCMAASRRTIDCLLHSTELIHKPWMFLILSSLQENIRFPFFSTPWLLHYRFFAARSARHQHFSRPRGHRVVFELEVGIACCMHCGPALGCGCWQRCIRLLSRQVPCGKAAFTRLPNQKGGMEAQEGSLVRC
jgi:hypothetical protein